MDDFANRVFNLPMIGEEGTSLEDVELDANFTFDPISEFRVLSGRKIEISSNKYSVSKLLNYLENSKKTSVRIASWERLLFLHKWELISDKETEELSETVKRLIDINDEVFRNYLKSFAINAFVRDEDYVEKYMESLIQKDFKESYSEFGFSSGTGLKYQLDEISNLLLNREYSENIYLNLFDKLKKWWANQYKWARKHENSDYFLRNDDLWNVVIFIKNTIFRNISKNMFNSQTKKFLSDCFIDLKEDENPGYILLIPGMLKIGYQSDDSINDLRYKMVSSKEDYKNNAIVALQDIAYYKNKKEIDINIRELKVLLLQLFAVYKESSLNYVSRTVSLIIKEDLKFFTNIEVKEICTSVNRFFDLYISSSEQNVFDDDDFIDIIKNYLDIIVELKNNDLTVNVRQWIEYCNGSKYLEINKYSYILEDK